MKLRSILVAAREHKASDAHILVGFPPMFRIAGDIVATRGGAITNELIEAMLNDSLNREQRARLDREWQLCASITLESVGRCRMTVYKRNGQHELSIRLTEPVIRTREDLRLPTIVEDLARKTQGLVVLTGPTGVGKTTTLHYMLDLINSERPCKIITIEDPIEFVHSFKRAIVVQQELLADVIDYTSALRQVLRQDPDVIAIGEMRDKETIYTALMAAETGHLVIATLHTPGAIDVVQRVVSTFPEGQQEEVRYMLANTFQGVIAQQLLPRASNKDLVICCEVMIGTAAVRHHIRSNDAHMIYSELQGGKRHGMVTFDQALTDLYNAGEITYDTLATYARHADTLKKKTAV